MRTLLKGMSALAGWLLLAATILLSPVSAMAAEVNYVPIYTKEDLDAIRNDLGGTYRLMNDITFTAEDFSQTGAFYNYGQAWRPIGYDSTHAFTGVFDGNGHTIRGLRVNTEKTYAGLFGYNVGRVDNVTMVECEVTSAVSSYEFSYAGGIVGYTQGDVTRCRVNGKITALSTSMFNNGYAGGVVGFCEKATVSSCHVNAQVRSYTSGHTSYHEFFAGGVVGALTKGTVENCTVQGTVSASYAGGIVGMVSGGTVNACWNAADIMPSGFATTFAGGIAGVSSGTVQNCYNIAPVKVNTIITAYVGGIVGVNDKGTVKTCYSLGEITAKADSQTHEINIGGIVGKGTATQCCYLEVTLPTNAVGTAAPNVAMKKAVTFTGFDFNGVWTMQGSAEYPYPELRAVPMTVTFQGPTLSKTTVSTDRNTTAPSVSVPTHAPQATTTVPTQLPAKTPTPFLWWFLIPMVLVLFGMVAVILYLIKR